MSTIVTCRLGSEDDGLHPVECHISRPGRPGEVYDLCRADSERDAQNVLDFFKVVRALASVTIEPEDMFDRPELVATWQFATEIMRRMAQVPKTDAQEAR